jgi:two-component system, NtrC family, sensor kinase
VTESGAMQQNRSVLLVDDAPANLRLLISILQATGLEVRPVLSGEMALTSARLMPPDLVLLDVLLPGMNGYEVIAAFRHDPALRHIPIVVLSAIGDERDRLRAFEVGASAWFTKPIQIDAVLTTLTELIGALD